MIQSIQITIVFAVCLLYVAAVRKSLESIQNRLQVSRGDNDVVVPPPKDDQRNQPLISTSLTVPELHVPLNFDEYKLLKTSEPAKTVVKAPFLFVQAYLFATSFSLNSLLSSETDAERLPETRNSPIIHFKLSFPVNGALLLPGSFIRRLFQNYIVGGYLNPPDFRIRGQLKIDSSQVEIHAESENYHGLFGKLLFHGKISEKNSVESDFEYRMGLDGSSMLQSAAVQQAFLEFCKKKLEAFVATGNERLQNLPQQTMNFARKYLPDHWGGRLDQAESWMKMLQNGEKEQLRRELDAILNPKQFHTRFQKVSSEAVAALEKVLQENRRQIEKDIGGLKNQGKQLMDSRKTQVWEAVDKQVESAKQFVAELMMRADALWESLLKDYGSEAIQQKADQFMAEIRERALEIQRSVGESVDVENAKKYAEELVEKVKSECAGIEVCIRDQVSREKLENEFKEFKIRLIKFWKSLGGADDGDDQ